MTYVLFRPSFEPEYEIILSCEERRSPNDQNYGYSIWSLEQLISFGWKVIGTL